MAERKSYTITPNNDADLPVVISKLYVGSTGHIKLELAKDSASVILNAVPAGTVIELLIKKIHATGTTASNLVGFSN